MKILDRIKQKLIIARKHLEYEFWNGFGRKWVFRMRFPWPGWWQKLFSEHYLDHEANEIKQIKNHITKTMLEKI